MKIIQSELLKWFRDIVKELLLFHKDKDFIHKLYT